MTLDLRRSTQFKKDLKKVIKQRKNLQLLEDVIQQLNMPNRWSLSIAIIF